MIREVLSRLVAGNSLDEATATAVMGEILTGNATAAQIAGFAVALRMKGETVDEVTGLARAMRAAAQPFPEVPRPLVDTCGTGGDGSHSFNVSTAVAFVVAAGGGRVAKHGNRAVSSRTGSADVLEALGVAVDHTPAEAARSIREVGVAFLFAPAYHWAFKHAAEARRDLGVRTVFNVLGPVCNPAGAERQLVGVYDAAWVPRLAEVLSRLGAESAWVVQPTTDWTSCRCSPRPPWRAGTAGVWSRSAWTRRPSASPTRNRRARRFTAATPWPTQSCSRASSPAAPVRRATWCSGMPGRHSWRPAWRRTWGRASGVPGSSWTAGLRATNSSVSKLLTPVHKVAYYACGPAAPDR